MVSNEATYVHGCLDKIVDFVRAQGVASLLDYEKRIC
jgi:hypothetical protein